MKKALTTAGLLSLAASPAFAHVGTALEVGHVHGFAAGFAHPFSGLDHLAVMVAVGLWAAIKGGRAVSAWPAAFVGVMLAGGLLGMAGMALPFVEPAILASVVALGLMVALAVDLPVAAGAAIIGGFALFHGFAHGLEAPAGGGALYLAGFALATALLHTAGIAAVLVAGRRNLAFARIGGLACIIAGIGLIADII